MRFYVVQFVLLVLLAGSARAASVDKSTTKQLSTQATPTDIVTPTPLLVITPEPIAMQPSDLSSNVGLKTGRAYYKSDEDYAPPSGHSAFEVAQYPAGHSAHDGAWATADEHDHKSHDVDAVPYHNYHSASGLHNPAHDPTLYQTFVPHYVSSSHGHPGGSPHDVDMPTYVVPASWPSASAPLAVHDYILHPGTAVLSGSSPLDDDKNHDDHDDDSDKKDSDDRTVAMLANVVPRSVALLLVKSMGFLLSTLGIVLFGGLVTSAVCALTPLCTLTFTLLPVVVGLRKTATSTLKKVLGETLYDAGAEANVLGTGAQTSTSDNLNNNNNPTGDRLTRAAQFVGSAIVKYQKMQDDSKTATTTSTDS